MTGSGSASVGFAMSVSVLKERKKAVLRCGWEIDFDYLRKNRAGHGGKCRKS